MRRFPAPWIASNIAKIGKQAVVVAPDIRHFEHIHYEAWMFRVDYRRLKHYGKPRDMNDLPTKNALEESFAVHARILDEFLRSRGADDTLKARHYTGGAFDPLPRPDYWDALIKRINKQITHLTDDRVGADFLDARDRNNLFAVLMDDLANFVKALAPEYRAAWEKEELKFEVFE